MDGHCLDLHGPITKVIPNLCRDDDAIDGHRKADEGKQEERLDAGGKREICEQHREDAQHKDQGGWREPGACFKPDRGCGVDPP